MRVIYIVDCTCSLQQIPVNFSNVEISTAFWWWGTAFTVSPVISFLISDQVYYGVCLPLLEESVLSVLEGSIDIFLK